MNIGLVIREFRKQKGFTQQELAEQARISVRTLQRIEKDKVEPSFFSLKSIGEILDVNLVEIFHNNSLQYTANILGIHLNDLTMKQNENSTIEERLEKIEKHLATIARTRSKQLRNRERWMVILGIVVGAFLAIEILAALHVFG
jgi:transcriptional regulator with XRE-family HTH domain